MMIFLHFGKINPKITHKSKIKIKHVNIFNSFVFKYFDYSDKFKSVSFEIMFNLDSISFNTIEIVHHRGTL